MAAFLWTIIVVMAVALVAQIVALVGIASVLARATRRSEELNQQVKSRVESSVRIAKELRQSLQPSVSTIGHETKEITSLVSTRARAMQATFADIDRRIERVRLRFVEGVETVEGEERKGRGLYRDVVEPIQTASQVVRGLKLALWILRKVA